MKNMSVFLLSAGLRVKSSLPREEERRFWQLSALLGAPRLRSEAGGHCCCCCRGACSAGSLPPFFFFFFPLLNRSRWFDGRVMWLRNPTQTIKIYVYAFFISFNLPGGNDVKNQELIFYVIISNDLVVVFFFTYIWNGPIFKCTYVFISPLKITNQQILKIKFKKKIERVKLRVARSADWPRDYPGSDRNNNTRGFWSTFIQNAAFSAPGSRPWLHAWRLFSGRLMRDGAGIRARRGSCGLRLWQAKESLRRAHDDDRACREVLFCWLQWRSVGGPWRGEPSAKSGVKTSMQTCHQRFIHNKAKT